MYFNIFPTANITTCLQPAGKDSGNLEVYMAANPRLKKPAEKRTITDFTIVKIIDDDLQMESGKIKMIKNCTNSPQE